MIRTARAAARSSPARWVGLGVCALLVAGSGCARRTPPQMAGGATTPKAQENRRRAETCAVDAVKAAADAQVAAHPDLHKKSMWERITGRGPTVHVSTPALSPPAAPKPPPIIVSPAPRAGGSYSATAPPAGSYSATAPPRSPVVIREQVVTDIPYPTEAEAEERAVQDAQDRIEQKLKQLDPPVNYRPSAAVVKNEYLRRGSRVVRPPTEEEKAAIAKAGYSSDRVYVEYTVELTAEQVRELRTRDRVGDGLRGLGVVTAVALAGFLFLRLDEWTKGYLTSWLALGAAALGGGVIAALVFV